MTSEDAIRIANSVLVANNNPPLTDIQCVILRESLAGKSYKEMQGYASQHLKNEGAQLWTLLSKALGEPVKKSNFQTALTKHLQVHQETCLDWGDAADVSAFWGRTSELHQIHQWMTTEQCRLIALVGMGGIGKTALAIKAAEQVAETFDFLIWRSLREAPALDDLLLDLIKRLSLRKEAVLPKTTGAAIGRLIHYLQTSRCLLVLDNAEALFQPGTTSGTYQDTYAAYGTLFQRLGQSRHQSCVLITSREKPLELTQLEGMHAPVRSVYLSGLSDLASHKLLVAEGLCDVEDETKQMIHHYGGNPLALKIAATTIYELFDNSTGQFLQHGTIIFDGIDNLLSQQFGRLSPYGQSILYWLAINREAASIEELKNDMIEPISSQQLLETPHSLKRRSLIESTPDGFTLQNVVMEYVTSRLIQHICQELQQHQFALFNSHALIKSTGKDYIRQNQTRLILAPIAKHLSALNKQASTLLELIRNTPEYSAGYAAGNLLNLLCYLSPKTTHLDFSGLTLRQAYLKGVNLHHINFSQCHFIQPALNYTFGAVSSLCFNGDGTLLIAGDSVGNVCLWDIESERCLTTFKGHASWIWSVSVAPQRTLIASTSEDQTIRLWDIATEQCVQVLQGHIGRVCSAAFSPDGQLLASASNDKTVRLWDLSTYQCVGTIKNPTDYEYWTVAFSPCGKQLAIAGEYNVQLWDLDSLQCLHTFQGHTQQVWSMVFTPDGTQLISTGKDETIRFWNLKTLDCEHILSVHIGWVWSIALSSNGERLISGGDDRTIRLWNLADYQCAYTLEGHFSRIRAVAYHPQNHIIASGSEDQTIRLWDSDHHKCIRLLRGYNGTLWGLTFSPDGSTFVGAGEDGQILIWDTQTYTCLRTFKGHTSRVRKVFFSPDGLRLASCSDDHTVRLWDAATGQCLQIFRGHISWVWSVTFSPDGQTLASTGEDGTIRFWDIQSRQCQHIIQDSGHRLWTVVFSPKGHLIASAGENKTVQLWDTTTYTCIQTYKGHDELIWALAFSPNGQFLASASADGTARIWDLENHTCVHILRGHSHWVLSVHFSLDGQILATSSADRTIRLWDTQTGDCLAVYQGHSDIVWALEFSPDGQTLASGSADETLKIWDTQTHHCIKTLQAFKPYEGSKIQGTTGLTEAQRFSMLSLGALNT
ncbi:MAG: NB-ARC domain-containing protein [Cyanobacteria bacterium P01_F01_bin.150]